MFAPLMNTFNVRVYGILLLGNEVLLCDELMMGKRVSKFPGGGLEFGEGTTDCLIREFQEELKLPIEINSHFYTTDFFVPSVFNSEQQVLSIYYLVKPINIELQRLKQIVDEASTEKINFRWVSLSQLSEELVTLVIDKKVALLLKQEVTGR